MMACRLEPWNPWHDGAACGLVPDASVAGEAKSVEFGIVEIGWCAVGKDTHGFVVGGGVLSGLGGLDVSIGVAAVGPGGEGGEGDGSAGKRHPGPRGQQGLRVDFGALGGATL